MVLATIMVAGATSNADPFFWYLTRMLAIGAYVALSLAVVLGLVISLARTNNERVSWIFEEAHMVFAILAGILTLGHLITLVVDPYLPFAITNLLIPLDQPVSTFAVDLGVLGMYGMLALLLSSWVKKRISYGVWRAIHYASFVAFVLVTLHGWIAGSDSATNWMPALYFGSSLAVATLVGMRFFTEPQPRRRGAAEAQGVPSTLVTALIIGVVGAFAMLIVENLFFTSAATVTQSSGLIPLIIRWLS